MYIIPPDTCHVYLVAGNQTVMLETIHEQPCEDIRLGGIEVMP